MKSFKAQGTSNRLQEVGSYADQSKLYLFAHKRMTKNDFGFDRFTDIIFYRKKYQHMDVSQLTMLLPDLNRMKYESHHGT